jgi:leucine-rich repeat protein SHOC2
MSYNMLEWIPDEIGQCFMLSTLDLQHNKLTNLPESIGNLKSLARLGLK